MDDGGVVGADEDGDQGYGGGRGGVGFGYEILVDGVEVGCEVA